MCVEMTNVVARSVAETFVLQRGCSWEGASQAKLSRVSFIAQSLTEDMHSSFEKVVMSMESHYFEVSPWIYFDLGRHCAFL